MNRFKALVLSVCLIFMFTSSAQGAILGPASTYEQLLELVASSQNGDVLLTAGELIADASLPLTTESSIHITSDTASPAVLYGLHLSDASISFSNITLLDSLSISGTSHIELGSGVSVKGSQGNSAVSFDGNGSLIMYPDCTVEGIDGDGVTIRHRGGDFYAGIEGIIAGGSGRIGGNGLTISPLMDTGTLMISGEISGGTGESMGGHALNLYAMSGNAFVTITGRLLGGDGAIGGDGIQLVSATDNVSVGIEGHVYGGQGRDYGGDALILMNMSGASSVSLSGSLTGGSITAAAGNPGTSLLVVDSSSAARTRVGDCSLQDGQILGIRPADPVPASAAPEPTVTPLPEITSSVDDAQTLITPAPTPSPSPTAEPTPTISATALPSPTAEPTIEPPAVPTLEPTVQPTILPTEKPSAEPTDFPTAEPTDTPTAEPSAAPASTPPVVPAATPTAEPVPEPTEALLPENSIAPTSEPDIHPTDEPAE